MKGNITKDGHKRHHLTISVCRVQKHSMKSGIKDQPQLQRVCEMIQAKIQLHVVLNSIRLVF